MAGNNIRITIQGDGESAKQALAMVQQQLALTAAGAKESTTKIQDALRAEAEEFQKAAASAAASNAKMVVSTQTAAEEIKAASSVITSALSGMGIVIGGQQAIEALKGLVTHAVDYGMEIRKASEETGIAAKDLSVMKYAADNVGVGFDEVVRGATRLSKALLAGSEENKQAEASFRRLGLSQADVKEMSGNLYAAMGKISERMRDLPEDGLRAGVAMGIFGRSGAQLMPLLDVGSDAMARMKGEAQALGIILDEQGVEKMAALHRSSVQLQGGLEGIALQITEAMEPALIQSAAALLDNTGHSNAFQIAGKLLGVVIQGLVTVWDYWIDKLIVGKDAFVLAKDALISGGKELRDAINGDWADMANTGDAMAAKMAENYKKMLDDEDRFGSQMVKLWSKAPEQPPAPVPKPTRRVELQDQSGNKLKSEDPRDRAAAALAEAEANAEEEAIKAGNASMLAILEAGHKAFLVSDEQYYANRLQTEISSLDAEADAARSRQTILQELLDKQKADKSLHPKGSSGESAQELETKAKLVDVEQKLTDLAERRATLNYIAPIEAEMRAEQTRLNTLKMAAEVEEQTNTSIVARLALLREESAEELKKISATAGNGSPEYQQAEALERLKEAKLELGQVTRQITSIEDDYKRAVEEVNDAAAKNPRLKTGATEENNRLYAEEAEKIKPLVAQFDALAAVMGGDALNKARDLHAELEKLSRPDERADSQFAKSLVSGVEEMAQRIGDATLSGRQSFHKMAQEMEKDALNLALKLAEQKWITPMMMGTGGSKLPQVNPSLGSAALAGMASAAPSGAGQKSAASPVADVFKQVLGGSGSKDGAPNVQIIIENGTSQPLSAQTTSSSWDSDAKEFIIHTVIQEASQGGALTQMFKGFGA